MIKKIVKFFYNLIRVIYYKITRSNKKFEFNGKEYKYFIHKYNYTFNNERSIEIPIIKNILKDYVFFKVLEVGNVLSHYSSVLHDVVDKYEKCNYNIDIIDFPHWIRKYHLIISISTLEHIGFDEKDIDPTKILKAIDILKKCLTAGGRIIFSIPIGQNPFLDNYIFSGKIGLSYKFFMKRISDKNEWKQVSSEEARDLKYDHNNFHANGIIIGIIDGRN